MHDAVEKIIALWEREQVRDTLLAESQATKRRIADAEAEVASGAQALAALTTQRAAVKADERQHNRRMEQYSARRTKTQSQLDAGQIHDFLVAKRQIDQYSEIIDTEETILLELMEQLEGLDEQIANAEEGQGFREHRLAEARRAREERLPSLRAEFEVATAARDDARALVPAIHHGRYDDLRRRKKICVAAIRGSTCGSCQVDIAGTLISEIRRGLQVHTCPSCKRFLYLDE